MFRFPALKWDEEPVGFDPNLVNQSIALQQTEEWILTTIHLWRESLNLFSFYWESQRVEKNL